MVLYGGIDLHSNNNVVVVQDSDDNVVGQAAANVVKQASAEGGPKRQRHCQAGTPRP